MNHVLVTYQPLPHSAILSVRIPFWDLRWLLHPLPAKKVERKGKASFYLLRSAPGSCTDDFCSSTNGQALAAWPHLTAREAGICSLWSTPVPFLPAMCKPWVGRPSIP